MARSRAKYTIEGPLHTVDVSLVTQKYINKIIANKGETVAGAYVSADNAIYIEKSQPETMRIHTVWHELHHVFEDQTIRMDQEAKADTFASWMMRLFPYATLEQILKVKERNEPK